MNVPELYTIAEAAGILKTTKNAVYKYIHNGLLGCHRFGRSIKVSADQLTEFVKNCEQEATHGQN